MTANLAEPESEEADAEANDDAVAVEDDDDSEIVAEDDDEASYGMTEVDHRTLKLAHLQSMLDMPQDDPFWPAFTDPVGAEKLRAIIAKLQAIYDVHCERSNVKSAADRAEAKAKARLN